MSKSDIAQEAAHHVRELAVLSGTPAEELIAGLAPEYEIEPHVVRAWVLREFDSLEALDQWSSAIRQAALEAESRNAELVRARDDKFGELAMIIDSMSDEAIAKAWLPQFTPWWRWIQKNCWSPKDVRDDALEYARARLLRRPSVVSSVGTN